MTHAAGNVAEHAVHHTLLHGEVDDGFVVAVVDAGKFGLLTLLLDDLYLFHQFGGQVAGSQLRVVQEEGLAVDGDLGDGFAVGGDAAVFAHFNAGELLEEVHQHIVVRDLERRGVVLDGVFLDDDGVAHGAYGSSVQDFLVLFHLDDAQIGIGLEFNDFLIGLVTQQFGLEGVASRAHLFNGGLAVAAGQGVLGLSLGGGHGYRGETYGFTGSGVL